ncbi:hypothetical protein ACJX0J_007426, partial [Zea mays]
YVREQWPYRDSFEEYRRSSSSDIDTTCCITTILDALLYIVYLGFSSATGRSFVIWLRIFSSTEFNLVVSMLVSFALNLRGLCGIECLQELGT